MPVSPSQVARVIGIETNFINLKEGITLFPVRLFVIGQGSTVSQASYSTDKVIVTSAKFVGDNYGYGSPLHLAVNELLPQQGGGVGNIPVTIFPLKDDGAAVATTGSITPVGDQTAQQTYYVKVNNIKSKEFTLAVDATVADAVAAIVTAISSVINMPIIATNVGPDTSVGLAAKWKGASGNDIKVEVVGTEAGIVFTTLVNSDGATNPDVSTALDQIGNIWESFGLNCLDIADTTTLAAYTDFFEPRWGATKKKPGIVFTGTTESDQAAAIVTPESRKTDRINSKIINVASDDLPFVVGAAELAKIAVVANGKPAWDYAGQNVTSLTPGADNAQWDEIQRDAAVKGGCSTIEVIDNVIQLSDTVTYYHPTGEEPPAYRFVNDIIKVWTNLFNLELIFAADEWKGAPLIPDEDPTTEPGAKKPKMAVAAIATMLDSLGLKAIASDVATAKKTIKANINDQNGRRLDVSYTWQISGVTGIISITANWGFFFGSQELAA